MDLKSYALMFGPMIDDRGCHAFNGADGVGFDRTTEWCELQTGRISKPSRRLRGQRHQLRSSWSSFFACDNNLLHAPLRCATFQTWEVHAGAVHAYCAVRFNYDATATRYRRHRQDNADGLLYVIEWGNHRLQVFEKAAPFKFVKAISLLDADGTRVIRTSFPSASAVTQSLARSLALVSLMCLARSFMLMSTSSAIPCRDLHFVWSNRKRR